MRCTRATQLLIRMVRGGEGLVAFLLRSCSNAVLAQLLTAVGLEPSDLQLKRGERVRLIATLDTPLGRIELG